MDPVHQTHNAYIGYYGTRPQKSHRGCSVPAFFCAVLSLCILGGLYVHWSESASRAEAADPQTDAVQNAVAYDSESAPLTEDVLQPAIGIEGDTVPCYVQIYYQLPAGVYIRTVDDNAAAQGLREDDIIIAFNETAIASSEELAALEQTYTAGDPVTLTIWRNGEQLDFCVILETEQAADPEAPQTDLKTRNRRN